MRKKIVHMWHKKGLRRTDCGRDPKGLETSQFSSEVNCNNCRKAIATYMPLDAYQPPAGA